jgi:endoglucanase
MAETTDRVAFEQNERLGRGVNIIGYDPLWQDMEQARMQAKHFALIKEAGFDSVRIPLHPYKHMGEGPEFAIREGWFEALDWALKQALANDLLVIMDLHEFNAMGDDPIGLKAKFVAAWRQLATRYDDQPQEVLFEILNEPCRELTEPLWNQYLMQGLGIIRATNPERTVIIGPGHWNNIRHLDSLVLPEEDRNIIVTVHYYRPGLFTHQGASWSSHQEASGIEWRSTEPERAYMREDFQGAQAWSKAHGRPIFLGEFGAYEAADMDSRVRYTSDVARMAEEYGWSWAYWQFDSDFIVYDIDEDHWVEPILRALIPAQ